MKMKWILPLLTAAGPLAHAATLEVKVSGLRSAEGKLAISVFAENASDAFPQDAAKAAATKYIDLQGEREATLSFEGLPAGTYALSVMHDEDADGKMKMAVGIPREGFGFSNNPRIYFGPPSFDKSSFALGPPAVSTEVRMKYMLR